MLIEDYFDRDTMSVHLRENSVPIAKKGVPGRWKVYKIDEKLLTKEKVQKIYEEILEVVENLEKSFLEIEREGSSIVQLGEYRIVMTKPPFSDGWEITAVRPVAKLDLKDYELGDQLKERLINRAEGVLIAGSPGEGKTTLARALAEHYNQQGKIVKTVESPRDMLLGDEITQYSLTYGSKEEVYDVLLLSRPDNTVFDEMRNTDDFQLFADLRMAGIGMIGIIHATNPIDAIQRFIGRIEMGVIPQVIDTVIFVDKGKVSKVLGLNIKVKVPSGMSEADLARPVVEVCDFSGKLEYEIYTYGEQTVVIPVQREEKAMHKLAQKTIRDKLARYTPAADIETISENKVVIYVPSHAMSKIIGRQGKEIEKLEKELGISIDLRELKEKRGSQEVDFDVEVRKNIVFYLDKNFSEKEIDIYSGEEYLLSAKSSKKAMLKVNRNSKIGEKVLDAVNKGKIRLKLLK